MNNKIRYLIFSICFLLPGILSAQEPQPEDEAPAPVHENLRKKLQERRAMLAPVPKAALSDIQKTAAHNFLIELIPEITAVLAELEAENPRAYARELRRAFGEMQMLERRKKYDKDEYTNSKKRIVLEHKSQMIVFRYRKAEEEQKEGLKEQLRTVLNQLFDLREIDREMQVQRLEKKLQELRASLKNRKPNKNRIIEKRLEKLLGVDKDLQW